MYIRFKITNSKMKKIFYLIVFTLTILNVEAQETETTTYYLIRHSEKVRTNKNDRNPNLNDKGKLRAENWSKVFSNVNFDFIYSTNYNRTVETATPTAKKNDLEVLFYNPRELFDEDFQEKTKGKTVLVVGHSNTTPSFVNKIIGKDKYPAIDDLNNANLYIVTISSGSISTQLLNIPN